MIQHEQESKSKTNPILKLWRGMIDSHINETRIVFEHLLATDAANNTPRWKSVSSFSFNLMSSR